MWLSGIGLTFPTARLPGVDNPDRFFFMICSRQGMGGAKYAATSTDLPSLFDRGSSSECDASNQSSASGSEKTVAASSKVTPCFLKFRTAFAVSHENTFMYIR